MSFAIRIKSENIRTVDAADVDTIYTGIGTAFEHPIRIFLVQNLTDVTLSFSDDGVNEKWRLPAGGFVLLDISSNQVGDRGFYYADGDRFYVSQLNGVPATTGSVCLTVWYGYNGLNVGGQG